MRLMKNPVWWLVIGVAVGALGFGVIRFATYTSAHVHYHANFAVYINGQREQFAAPGYYEEIASCSADQSSDPHQRVHMHDQVNDVVHVHANAVTWGQFFENIGWSISKTHIENGSQLFVTGDTAKLSYILNGEAIDDVTNRVIKSEDRLLVNYGNQGEAQLTQEYTSISASADHYNATQDPASCSGDEPTGWRARLRHVFN